MKDYQNLGWYIVPFSVEDDKTEEWVEYINSNFIKNDIILTRYFFTYVAKVFEKNEFACSFEIPKKYIENIKLGKLQSVDVSSVSVNSVSLFMFNKNVGFIVYKVNYGNLTCNEIEDFSFDFKRCTKDKFSNNSLEGNNLIDINRKILTDNLATPFFYSSNDGANNCNIFQFVYTDDTEIDLTSLARGYRHSMDQNIDFVKRSKVDMCFSAHPYIEWAGCQSVLVCLAKTNSSVCSEENLGFIKKIFPQSIENDYLFMYLLLLNQRYTLMYFMSKLIENKNNYNKLTKLENELTLFNLESCFNVISNEMTYQNVYDQIRKILDINMLLNDIQDINQRLVQHEREIDSQNEHKMNSYVRFISVLSILSVLVGIFTDHFKWSIFIPIAIWVTIIVVLLGYHIHCQRNRKQKRTRKYQNK